LSNCKNFFIGAFCGKFETSGYFTYYHSLTVSLHYLVKYKMCKKTITIWWVYQQEFGA